MLLVLSLFGLFASAHPHKPPSGGNAPVYRHGGARPVPARTLSELPRSFSWCWHNGVNICTPNWNQHQPRYCGGCWIHGSLSAANDRIAVLHHERQWKYPATMLARQDMLTCARDQGFGGGCNGGSPQDVYEYMAQQGLPDETCNNFMAANGQCNPLGRCQNCMPNGDDLSNFTCWPVKDYVTYRVKEYGNVRGEEAIMTEILARGPIVCNVACPENFVYAYHGGIFEDVTKSRDVDHDVEVVGWGEEHGKKYWTIRNSWGSYWGEGGFFRLSRGDDALLMESVGCTFPVMDISDEDRMLNNEVVGSMYGLVTPQAAPQYSLAFSSYAKDWLMNPVDPSGFASHPWAQATVVPLVNAMVTVHAQPTLVPVVALMAAAVGVLIFLYLRLSRQQKWNYDMQ